MKKSERIGNLLFRYVRKELSRDEEMELTAWRYASPENEGLFQEKTNRENILAELAHYLESKDRIFQKIKERYPETWKQPSGNKRLRIHRILGIAAIFIVILGAGWYFILNNQKTAMAIQPGRYQAVLVSMDGIPRSLDDFHRGFLLGSAGIQIEKKGNGDLLYIAPNDSRAPKDKYIMLYTLRGGQFSLRLPDGTIIWLNAQSSIKFPANFSQDSLLVTVDGEAYFEVAKNANVHLRIIAGPIQIEAPGAHLNIMYYPDEPTDITMTEGSAEVLLHPGASGMSPSEVSLHPYDQAKFAKWPIGEVLKKEAVPAENVQDIIAWKNGITSFRDADIQTIMRALSRWYNTDIIYNGDIPDQQYNLHLPRSASLYRLLSVLEKQGGHFTVQGKTITVMK